MEAPVGIYKNFAASRRIFVNADFEIDKRHRAFNNSRERWNAKMRRRIVCGNKVLVDPIRHARRRNATWAFSWVISTRSTNRKVYTYEEGRESRFSGSLLLSSACNGMRESCRREGFINADIQSDSSRRLSSLPSSRNNSAPLPY